MNDDAGRTNRRRFLAATATLAGAGVLAGCQEPADETIAADHVALPSGGLADLGLTETVRSTRETRRTTSSDGTETIYAIEHAVTAYGAAEREPMLLDRFVEAAAPTPTPTPTEAEEEEAAAVAAASNALGAASLPDHHGPVRSAVVVPGERVGARPKETFVFEEAVSFDSFSIVVPEVARAEEDVAPADTIGLLYPPETSPELTVQMGAFSVPMAEFFPAPGYTPSTEGSLAPDGKEIFLSRWFPDGTFSDEESFTSDSRVLVVIGERGPEEVFGLTAEEMPGERLEAGQTFDATGNNPFLVATPGVVGDVFLWDEIYSPKAFDAGSPAPMGGGTFGLGALVTPDATVGGEQLNDLLEEDLAGFLASEQGRELVGDALPFSPGVPDYAPRRVSAGERTGDVASTTTVLGAETAVELYGGAVEGEHGPWWVGVHAVRTAREEDTVFALGAHARPIGSAEVGDRPVIGDAGGDVTPLWPKRYIREAGEMAAASLGRLQSRD